MSILNTYLRDISRYQRLTIEQELTLGEQARAGDQQARKRLIEAYLILPVNIAYQNLRPEIDLMDLIQEGNIGLIKAVDMFDPAQGTRLGTLARFWVEKYILRFLRNEQEELVSLDLEVVDSGETLLLRETIEDRGSIMGDQGIKNIDTLIEQEELKQQVQEMLSALPEREQKVLRLLYGLDGYPEMSREEISKLMGVCPQYISRIRIAALKRLQDFVKAIDY
jgi:RNA polymerase sigma factor (sigma-70 family)